MPAHTDERMNMALHQPPSTREETRQLSWEETYRAMAAESEDWSEFDVTVGDGVD